MDHPHLRARRSGATTLLVVVAMLAGACAGGSSRAGGTSATTTLPNAGPTTIGIPIPPGWKIPDTRNAVLLAAPGQARAAPVAVLGGSSRIIGTVMGPDGPVSGASVRIERFAANASGSTQVITDASGRFVLAGALGGRFRVRAWLQPDLATFTAPTGFVTDGGSLDLSPTLERRNAVILQVAPAQAALTYGQPGGVVAVLTRETVDANGIVRPVGVAGTVLTLVVVAGLAITSTNPVTSDAAGSARWVLQCTATGSLQVSASAPGAATSATLLDCPSAPSASSTTTTATRPTTNTPGGA